MPDPNWLLSTSAQSAAAIVAIIGGFLVSRIVTLSSERSGTQAHLAEIRNSLDLNSTRLRETEDRIITADVLDFIDSCLDDVVDTKGQVTLERLMKDHPRRHDVPVEKLRPSYESMVADTTNEASPQTDELYR